MDISLDLDPDRRLNARLLVDLDAIARNYARLAALAPGAETAAVVKADAYGLGAPSVARRLARDGCRTFFVATADEGSELRRSLGDGEAEIWVLNGFAPSLRAQFAEQRLGAILNSQSELEGFMEAPAGPCALHIDTGMNRLGLPMAAARALAADSVVWETLDLRLVMSHLVAAEDGASAINQRQRDAFLSLSELFPSTRKSLSNTGGVLLGEDFHFDLTRPGIGLFGATAGSVTPDEIEPVVALEAPILQLRSIQQGESVGYGATYVADWPRVTATIAAGYADGLPRALSGRGYGRIKGAKAPLLGRVSMDLAVVDVTECVDAAREEGVVQFFGRDLADLASLAETLPYELLTSVGARVTRSYGALL